MNQKSHTLQIMQNYFDLTDVRSRANCTSLENQLLNLAAVELEDLDLRITRENSLLLQTVPANIDNEGVYFGGLVPPKYLTGPDQKTFNSVVGAIGTEHITLTPYNDTLPIPTRVSVNSSGSIAFPNPIVIDVIGEGDDISRTYTVKYANPGNFIVPNKLTLWIDQIGLHLINVIVTVTGQINPKPAWVSEQKETVELIQITEEGVAYSFNRWASISEIVVRNLPVGVRLRGWSLPFNLPAAPDTSRPSSTVEDRNVLYSRYWQIDNTNAWLNEMYEPGGFTELTIVNSYAISDTLVDVAVEPFTNGMFLASSSKLYYVDRREYFPDLSNTGLFVEPLYGLQISRDDLKYGPITYVILKGVPYSGSGNIVQYRYVVNGVNSVLPDGSLGPINAGWRIGTPQAVSFPLLSTGDYIFQLQCQDNNGAITFDIVTFRNAAVTLLSTLDLSSSIDNIVGITFDSYGQLWVWNGSYIIPITLSHDGYVLDTDTGTIYTTEPFTSLQIS